MTKTFRYSDEQPTKGIPFRGEYGEDQSPSGFPEIARGRTFAQPFNIKVKPLRPRRQGLESYNRAQMALLGLGVFAAVSAALIVLRVAVFLPSVE
jgi:hypothetical protein